MVLHVMVILYRFFMIVRGLRRVEGCGELGKVNWEKEEEARKFKELED